MAEKNRKELEQREFLYFETICSLRDIISIFQQMHYEDIFLFSQFLLSNEM